MFEDSLQKRLQEMERGSPSPSLETAKPTLKERIGFLVRAVEQIPQRSHIKEKILRDVLYNSHSYWINSDAEEFAKKDFQIKVLRDLGINTFTTPREDMIYFHDGTGVGVAYNFGTFIYTPDVSKDDFNKKSAWEFTNGGAKYICSEEPLLKIIDSCRTSGKKSEIGFSINPEEIVITKEHYEKAIKKLGNAFLVDESDVSLKNIFDEFKMIAHRGKMEVGDGGFGRDVIYGVSEDGKSYSVECQTRVGGDEVSVHMGDTNFSISDRGRLEGDKLHDYGSKIPKNILTQVLNGRVDEDRRMGERDYNTTYRTGTGRSPADPIQEFWARLFPGSIRAEEFDDRYNTNYSGRRNASTAMTAKDVWDAKWGRGKYAGKTGDRFIDDPFFNNLAPGGRFNK